MANETRDEFERALKPLGSGLVVLARRLVGSGSGSEAEDVLQAALASAWARFREGERVEFFRAWIAYCLPSSKRR